MLPDLRFINLLIHIQSARYFAVDKYTVDDQIIAGRSKHYVFYVLSDNATLIMV